jgi:thioredoxin reductase (NADPH)
MWMKFLLCFSLLFSSLSFASSEKEEYPVVVLGGGIGGLTSALYLARSGMTPLVIEGNSPGGLLTQSHSVQNWPGEVEIDGSTLMNKVHDQAEKSGVQFLKEEVIAVDFSKRPFIVSTTSHQIQTNACIIAMGTQPNFLGVSGEQNYWGKGVTNCAVCDGPLYKDQTVGVIGGGDAAILEALYLADLAKETLVFVRKSQFKTTDKQRLETLLNHPKIKVIYDTEVVSIEGDKEKVTGVTVKSIEKKNSTVSLDGVFLAIGSKPNTALFKKSLQLDQSGYIVLKEGNQTSIEGVYAVGDIVDPVYKQAISASGDGAKTALQISNLKGIRFPKKEGKLDFQTVSTESLAIEITSSEQFQKEMATDKLVVVDFYASWCGPCKTVSPLLDSLAERLSLKLKVLKVNIDQCPSLAKSYQVKSVPTLLLFNASGELIDRKSGTAEITQIVKDLETNFDQVASR